MSLLTALAGLYGVPCAILILIYLYRLAICLLGYDVRPRRGAQHAR